VRTLQSRDNTFELGDHLECLETLEIVSDDVFCSTRVVQVRVLGSDRVVVEALRSAMGFTGCKWLGPRE
jgi:hypothetical protein